MQEDIARQLNQMNRLLQSQNAKMGKYANSMGSVMEDMEKLFTRFKPTRMYNYLNDSEDAVNKLKNQEQEKSFGDIMSGIDDSMTNLEDSFSISSVEDLLETLIDINLDKDLDIGTLDLEGMDTTPQNLINTLQGEIDSLAEKTNNFYDILVEERFNGDMNEEIQRFKEDTEDWLNKMDDELKDMFNREEDYREFKRDTNDFLDDFSDNVEDTGNDLGNMMDRILSADTASIASLFSLGGLRGDIQSQFASLDDVRREFMSGLGKTREEWAEFFKEDREDFQELNRNAGYVFSYRDDYIRGLNEAMETGIADEEMLHKLSMYATEFGDALGNIDLQSWTFVHEVIDQMSEGEEAVEGISEHIAFLQNERGLDVVAEDLMSNVQMFNEQLKILDDGTGRVFESYSKNLSQAFSVLKHGHLETEQIMGDFKKILSGEGLRDVDLMRRFSLAGLDVREVQEQLREGNFTGVLEQYYEGVMGKLSDIGLRTREDFQQITASQTSVLELMDLTVDEAMKFVSNTERVEEGFNKIIDSEKESIGYIKEYNEENSPEGIWERAQGWFMVTDIMSSALDYWQRLGMSGEAFLGIIIGISQGLDIFGVNLGSALWGNEGLIEGLKQGKGLLGKTKSLISGGLSGVKNMAKLAGGKLLAGFKGVASTISGASLSGVGSSILGGIKAAGAAITGFLTSPLGIALAVVAAVAAGVYLIYKNWDKVKAIAGRTWDFVKEKWENVKRRFNEDMETLLEYWDGLMSLGGNVLSYIQDRAGVVGEFIKSIPSNLKDGLLDVLDFIPDWVQSFIAPWSLVIEHWDSIKEKAFEVKEKVIVKWGDTKEWFGDQLEGASQKWDLVKERSIEIKDNIVEKWVGFKGWLGDKFNVGNKIEVIRENAFEVKDEIIGKWTGFKDWLGGMFDADDKVEYLRTSVIDIKQEIKEHWSGFKGWLGDKFNINVEGIEEDVVVVKENILSRWSDFKGRFRQFFTDIKEEGFLPTLEDRAGNIKENILSRWSDFSNKMSGFISDVKEEGFLSTLEDRAIGVRDELYEVWGEFSEWFEGIFNIDLDEIFGDIGDYFSEKINVDFDVMFGSVDDFFVEVARSFTEKIEVLGNPIIRILNSMIGGLNKISIEVPKWIPKWGGNKWGFDIPEIPLLAEGAIATEPTLAGIAEGNQPEAIVPLDRIGSFVNDVIVGSRNDMGLLEPALSTSGSLSNTGTTILRVETDNQDVVDVIEWQTKRVEKKLDTLIENTNERIQRRKKRDTNPLRDRFYNID